MSDPDTGGEKVHDATPRKLEDARKKGDIAKSLEIGTAAAYASLLIVLATGGSAIFLRVQGHLSAILTDADLLAVQVFSAGNPSLLIGVLLPLAVILSPLFLIPMAASLLSIMAQQALIFAPDKIVPKLSRISPITGAKNKFGASGMMEFAKSLTKLITISLFVGVILSNRIDSLIGAARGDSEMLGQLLGEILVSILILVTAIACVIAVFDLLWQRFSHAKRNRMTHQEVRDEYRDSEGDPHIKSQRRNRAQEIATNRMLVDVPGANVVIVNPTHYAVALKWAGGRGSAPVCVAKGQDEVAQRIRETAALAGVPIHSDPPTARALFASVDIGHEIPTEQYRAVAIAIQFADRMRAMARKR